MHLDMFWIAHKLTNTFISSLFIPWRNYKTLKDLLRLKSIRKNRGKNFADTGDRTRNHKVDVGITNISIFGQFFDEVPTISDTGDYLHFKIYVIADIYIIVKFWYC